MTGADSSEQMQKLDDPRSYREMFSDAFSRNTEYFFLAAGLSLFFLFSVYLMIFYHIHIAEVPTIVQAEQDASRSVADGLPWHYLNAAMAAFGGFAGLWMYSKRRAEGGSGV